MLKEEFNQKPQQGGSKPYNNANAAYRRMFGRKVYKIALASGCTCPNRDGTLSTGGCSFCAAGSGDFAEDTDIDAAIARVEKKAGPDAAYIAYFQSYTNTYGDTARLTRLYESVLADPRVCALSVATRPDCLGADALEMLTRLRAIKPVWVELGLQTMHEATAAAVNRGYTLDVYEDAVRLLRERGLSVVTHLILGLPGESRADMMASARYAGEKMRGGGLKLQMLHVLRGAPLEKIYRAHPFELFTREDYVDFVIDIIERLPPDVVLHRITGDGAKKRLIAPLWSANKRAVLNLFARRFRERGTWQGRYYS